jgi:hypothetical protein
MNRRDAIAKALSGSNLDEKATAIADVGMLALGHPEVLAAMIRLSADPTPLPAAHQPPSTDPFADFFGTEAAPRTFAQHATERIFQAGLPGHAPSAQALIQILETLDDPVACATVARLFSETRWEDPEDTARALIPALHKRDVSLASTLAGADPTTLDILITSALTPYRSRAVNELMNAPHAREKTVSAIKDQLDHLTPARLAEALAVLISWKACDVPDLVRLEERSPWVAAFTALLDATAARRIVEGGPADLSKRLEEAQS